MARPILTFRQRIPARLPVLCVAALLGQWSACGGEQAPPTSAPIAPTVAFDVAPEPEAPMALDGLFPTDGVALPEVLAPMRFGLSEAEVRQRIDSVRDTRFPPPPEQRVGRYLVLGGTLKGWESIGFSLILDRESGTLEQVDLSLPIAEALPALTRAFGVPDANAPDEGATAVWNTEGLRASLFPGTGELAVCKYSVPK